jgi:predicted GNAT family N-acyltransferase
VAKVIRNFNPVTDFPALVVLLNDPAKVDLGAFTTETEQQDFKATFEKYGHVKQWVLEPPKLQGVLIAYASLFKQSATPYAEFQLIVYPEFRGQHLEEELLGQIISEAKAQYLYDLVDVNNKER